MAAVRGKARRGAGFRQFGMPASVCRRLCRTRSGKSSCAMLRHFSACARFVHAYRLDPVFSPRHSALPPRVTGADWRSFPSPRLPSGATVQLLAAWRSRTSGPPIARPRRPDGEPGTCRRSAPAARGWTRTRKAAMPEHAGFPTLTPAWPPPPKQRPLPDRGSGQPGKEGIHSVRIRAQDRKRSLRRY